jgi:excisionase family DNA binding protein
VPCVEEVPTRKATDGAVERNDHLLRSAEVAALFRVDTKTVRRWAQAGKLKSVRTLGGHRRYSVSQIRSLFEASEWASIVDIMDSDPGAVDIPDHHRVTN